MLVYGIICEQNIYVTHYKSMFIILSRSMFFCCIRSLATLEAESMLADTNLRGRCRGVENRGSSSFVRLGGNYEGAPGTL
jgi:hypothetical protein